MSTRLTRRALLAGVAVCPRLLAQSARLRSALKGRLIVPGDRDYDSARRVASFNPTSDKHPEMIVRCAEQQDVVRAIAFARENALDVAVRSGGHDLLGASVCDGMVIDLSTLKKIGIDRHLGTARVEAGVRAGELNAATQPAGLAAVLGCNPAVGVAGLTLGGGLGWFAGKYGAACDHLIGADVVTAEGEMLHATVTENADLFWALRGGGGNFGVVTALEYQLHPVAEVLGGAVTYRTDIGKFLNFYRDFMETAPDDLAVEVNIFMADQPTILAIACWSGDAAEGQRVLAPLRAFGPPIADRIDTVAYSQLGERRQAPPREDAAPGYNYWRGGSLPALSNEAVDHLAAAMEHAPAGRSMGLGHYMHGQVCRVAANAPALPRTAGQLTYFFSASWRDPRTADGEMDWVNRSWAAMKRFSTGGAYINYLSSDDASAVEASYGKSFHRLAQLKQKYDPANFFHHNRNIRPAAGARS